MIKKIHMYWGGQKLSYLRYLTFYTLQKYNPDWEIILYVPKHLYVGDVKWISLAHIVKYRGPDYFDAVVDLGIKIVEIDFTELGFKDNIPEPYKSDFLQWYKLYYEGGFWTDTDVVYYAPLKNFNDYDLVITADWDTSVYYIAYMYAEPHTAVMYRFLKYTELTLDAKNYQAYGNSLVHSCYPKWQTMVEDHPNLNILLEHPEITLPVKCITYIRRIYDQGEIDYSKSIGLHWFGGHPLSGRWENTLISPTRVDGYPDLAICKLIKECTP